MNLLVSREFWRAMKRYPEQRGRCDSALRQFREDFRHPGLNFEKLGSTRRQNHFSIRASQEWRIILALPDPERLPPDTVMVVNFGHHDQAYGWSERQGHHSDADSGVDPRPMFPGRGPVDALWATGNFEEWQVFLHPEQREHVTRRFPGPARIQGGPGTGKTVIALHRTAWTGRKYPGQRILFTTFSRSLITHLADAFRKLPDPPGNVEFRSVYQVAREQLGDFEVCPTAVSDAFRDACDEVLPGTSLERCSRAYLREEIECVIKGQCADDAAYLDTGRFQRIGRVMSFRRRDRETCLRLMHAWNARMRALGTDSWADVILRALAGAEETGGGRYRAIVVDEAQDMTVAQMRFLRAVLAGSPDNPVPENGFVFLDDPAQKFSPGGFLPGPAGLSVRNRSFRLSTGYRTTREIMNAARDIRASAYRNTDQEAVHATYPSSFAGTGDGGLPVFLQCQEGREILCALREVEYLVDEKGLKPEEIGILMKHNADVRACVGALSARGTGSAPLGNLRTAGSLPDGVRVGTLDRAKGMEFRAVLVLRLGASLFPGRYVGEDEGDTAVPDVERPDEEVAEHRLRMFDRLYVGMTRAREYLVLIASEAPCEEIGQARDRFDWYLPNRPRF